VQRMDLDEVIDDSGFGQNALTMALPYMAPDNNNSFFGDVLAKFFIMNEKRTASKAPTYTPPLPKSQTPYVANSTSPGRVPGFAVVASGAASAMVTRYQSTDEGGW